MLSLMLSMGIISRLVSGWLSDRIGGLRTLLLGSVLQGVTLWMFLLSNGLVSLYVISALFGMFQGGIVPAYAVLVREYFTPKEIGSASGGEEVGKTEWSLVVAGVLKKKYYIV